MKCCLFRKTGRAHRLKLAAFPVNAAVLCLLLLGSKSGLAAELPLFAPLPTQPGIELTNGIILISPARLNFGAVPLGQSATNTFLVENFGHGKLVGKASVPAPFKIISGEKYSLREKEVQVVTIVYTPERARRDRATVSFSGGNGGKALVIGKAAGQ